MSDVRRVLLIGATGLVGKAVIAACAPRPDIHLVGLARREMAMPPGARIELLLSDPSHWTDAIADARAETVVIALGTTIKAVDGDRTAFRAVDHDLVLACARAAKQAGVRQLIVVSSVGAALSSRNFYLSVKGEVEDQLVKLHFDRLDILRPGLLRGQREGAGRPAERLGMMVAPVADILLAGSLARYRSVRASDLGRVIVALAGARPDGRFVHHNPEFRRLLAR
ncbi:MULTISPECIES: NAD(P)H-binding protein [Novosphingobium]|uniref:NAD(P)H-binding protein n=1 Tax=Novosphingobium TaxID=165696 RepID=UPI001CD6C2D0|nr:NAD(P)H-binding protein [Novosphingobium percolationis]MCH7629275.1 NAD(P)H-binding protein [Pseudomonadota bacterium]